MSCKEGGVLMDLKETIDLRLQDPNTILEIYKQFLGDYVRQSDKEYKFSSHWASDTSPSMGVDPNRMGMYKDLSSGEKGNIYVFLKVMLEEGKINKKPLLWLADYFNIEVKKQEQKPYLIAPMAIMQQAKEYLNNNPQHKQLLIDKGFGEEQIRSFNGIGLGYLDDGVYRKRYFIPILNDNDELIDIRLYDPTHSKPGMKCLHFYLFLENINKVPKQIQKAMKQEDLDALQRGEKVKLIGFGKGRLANLSVFNFDAPIYIMEGERDMFNALRVGLNATCITGGADTWDIGNNYRFQNKDVIIVMDNDSAGLNGAYKKANSLSGVAKSIKVIKIPLEEKGSDFADYISQYSIEDFKVLVENTTEYRVTHIDKQKPQVDIDKKSTARRYAQYLYSIMDMVYVNKQGFYIYQREGFWKNVDDMDIKKELTDTYDKFMYKEPTARNLSESLNALQFFNYKAERPNTEHKYMNLINGLFDIQNKTLIPHTKNIFTSHQLPINYDPKAECPRFMQYLKEVFPEDTQQFMDLIGEILGYCMTTDTSFQKAFIFIGTGANGKSVMIDVLESLVGRENISAIGFAELANSFARSQLKDKLVNVGAEIEFSTTANSSYFKQIVAGDTIDAEEKFKPKFHFKPFIKLVYSTNGFPATKDRSEGNFRRYVFIPFDVYFPPEKQDKYLSKKLKEELSGIFNFALEGMKRLYKNSLFTEPKKCTDMLNEFKDSSSPLMIYVKEECKQEREKRYKRSEFVKKYKEWCFENGYKPLSTSRISKELEDNFRVRCKRYTDGWYYEGIHIEANAELWDSATKDVDSEAPVEEKQEKLKTLAW